MRFRVKVKDISIGYLEVEAEDEADAEDKALEIYNQGNVFWNDGTVEFKVWNKEFR